MPPVRDYEFGGCLYQSTVLVTTPVEERIIGYGESGQRPAAGCLYQSTVVVTTPVEEVLVGDERVVGGQLEDVSISLLQQ